jgi:hypothetical protein
MATAEIGVVPLLLVTRPDTVRELGAITMEVVAVVDVWLLPFTPESMAYTVTVYVLAMT